MPSQEGLEAYYSFDGPEVSGQTVDNSGNYIHADVAGATQVDSAQGLAYSFDGTDDSIVSEEVPAMSSGPTLAAMCTPDTLNDATVGDMIISHEDEPVYLSVTDAGRSGSHSSTMVTFSGYSPMPPVGRGCQAFRRSETRRDHSADHP
jgi:hypothetical protein